ncbi:divalent-cation tolerance protein CutA [Comamonas sp. JC664]|uniref:divalent-cation tolerance protein CutA n=1 Tax=Comamonas sp. JC664 TaxID=2801917 RepID=UPI00174C3C88|nr:divalent-cation tolerance protein CutA [Comamonas sp. JC664]MBL0697150.1 divalent-cation tolerance protein CutA [Comamonas sp. JC664]GHG82809.1 divalent-cation tolerance protein CutA [Comamonas sp. KCTC 72670]
MTDAILVLVTAPSTDKAAELARTLVEEQLAACGNLIPGARSIYRWEGRVQDEPEVLLILKTRAALFEPLRARIVALHPYDVPEVLRLDVADGHAPYLSWILGSTRAPA